MARELVMPKLGLTMAQEIKEVEDIQTICGGLCINIGTLGMTEAMILAGKKANELGHPVVLDPVGVGASRERKETVERLMKEVHFTVIRGNISEIKAIAMDTNTTRGVDAAEADAVNAENIESVIGLAKKLAAAHGWAHFKTDRSRKYVQDDCRSGREQAVI